jgi:hypothetical protein
MKKETFYFILLLIQITFFSNCQTSNDNQIVFQKAQTKMKPYDVLSINSHRIVNDSLIIAPNNYQSYQTGYIISESIGASLIGLYARSSWNNGTSTNIGFLYSGIGAATIGFILKLKAIKMKESDGFAKLHNASKAPILTFAPLLRSEKGFNEFGIAIRF